MHLYYAMLLCNVLYVLKLSLCPLQGKVLRNVKRNNRSKYDQNFKINKIVLYENELSTYNHYYQILNTQECIIKVICVTD